jgi:hypothetical protein
MKRDNLAIEYGTYIGIAAIVYFFVINFMGLSTNKSIGAISYLLLLGGLFLVVKKVKEVRFNGVITFGQAYGVAFKSAVFASILVGIFTYMFYQFIDPDAINQILEVSEQEMYKQGQLSEEQIEQSLKLVAKFTTPVPLAVTTFFSYTIIGALLALIPSAILRTKK